MENEIMPLSNTVNLYDTSGVLIFESIVERGTLSYNDYGPVINAAIQAGVDLSHADLAGLQIHNVDFQGKSLRYADIQSTNFYDCDLSGVDISEANIESIYIHPYRNNLTGLILPERLKPVEGAFTMYKIVKVYTADYYDYDLDNKYAVLELEVPADARRVATNIIPVRYRVDFATPVKLYTLNREPLPEKITQVMPPIYDDKDDYYLGEVYRADTLDENLWDGCSFGINGFLTFEEAIEYYNDEIEDK